MRFLHGSPTTRIQPSHDRGAAETDLLAASTMWDLVSRDELVDRVASDPEQTRDLVDVEHALGARLLVVRGTDRWRRERGALARCRKFGGHGYNTRKNATTAVAAIHGER